MARKSILSKLRMSEVPSAAGEHPGELEPSPAARPPLAALEEPPTGLAAEPATEAAQTPVGESERDETGADSRPPEASTAIAKALSEAGEAAQKATEALEAEGLRISSRAPQAKVEAPHERPKKTKAQLMRAAKRERDFGRKLLAHRTGGFASRLREARINNGPLAAAFERFFPVIERCAYLLARHGGAALGDPTAEKLLDRMRELTEEIHADLAKELEAAQAYIGEQSVKLGKRFVTPEFTAPAYTGTVQLRTPQSDRVLDVFLVSDEILTEFETLYWNGLRSMGDRNEQMHRSKRTVRPLFTFAAATTRNLYRRMHEQAGGVVASADARPQAAEALAAAGVEVVSGAPLAPGAVAAEGEGREASLAA